MNKQYQKESLEVLLKDSLKVNPLCNKTNFQRHPISRSNVSNQNVSKLKNTSSNLLKTSRSLHKDKGVPKLVKYPLSNIPLGLEQQSRSKPPLVLEEKTNPKSTEVKTKSSTADFIEKLKQIETKMENATFLEEANEEISVAYKQLQEIQKLIERKMYAGPKLSDVDFAGEADLDQIKRKHCHLIDKCSKQLEKMQKKYLNKTKIHYKSLQDFENVTLSQVESNVSEELLPREKEKKVEVLFSRTNSLKFPATSTETFQLPQKDFKCGGEPLMKRQTMSLASNNMPAVKSERASFEIKTRFPLRAKGSSKVPQIKSEMMQGNNSRNRKESSVNPNSPIDSNKIKYLLKPEHHSPIYPKKSTNELTQSDTNRNEIKYVIKQSTPDMYQKRNKSVEFCNDGVSAGQKFTSNENTSKTSHRVTFKEKRLNQSVLKSDHFLCSSEELESPNLQMKSHKDRVVQNSSKLLPFINRIPQSRVKSVKDESSQAGGSNLKDVENLSSPILQRKLRKIDESILATNVTAKEDKADKKLSESRRKLNLLLNSEDKLLTEKFDDAELAKYVLNSAYLSKEFSVGPKNGMAEVNNDKTTKKSSMQLVEAVIQKFKDKLQPNQLANLKGRDWKLYSSINKVLQDTFFDRVKK